MRQHLEAAALQGRPADGLVGPPAPPELAYMLRWFAELSATRGSTGFGALPISYVEIEAWARLTGVDPSPFEVECLRALDAAFLRGLNNGRPSGNQDHRR